MTSIDREAFEAWYKNNFGEPDFLRGACGTYYMNSSVDFAWQTWQAALAQANVNEQSQAQQSQWISVEERLPEGDVFVDVYVRSRSNANFMQRETSVAFVSGKFKINRIFDCEYVSHWMVIPPAPMNEVNKPEGE